MTPGDDEETERISPRVILGALALVVFTYSFQQTAILPAIPTVEHALHATRAWSAWLLSGYLMVATVVTPALGRLGDIHGEARVLLWSLGIFFAGSVGAALLPGLPALIVCRAAQGAGGAVLPLAFAILRRHFDDGSVSGMIARLMGMFGLGATIGFATGGLMAQLVSWRIIFGTGAVLVAAGVAVLARAVPRGGGHSDTAFDLGGAVWLGGASLLVLLGLTVGADHGFATAAPIALLAGGALSAALWVRTELHHDAPLIDLRVLTDRTVLFVNGATAGLGWTRFVGLLLIPELVRGGHGVGFGADATLAGLYLVPDGFGTMIGGPLAGGLARRGSPSTVFAGGLAVMAAGGALIAGLLTASAAVFLGAFLLGFGGGIATQASSAVTTRDVPQEAAGASSALNSTVRRFSGGVGGQVSTIVLAVGAGTVSRGGFEIGFAVAAALAAAAGALALRAGRQAA